MREIPPRIANKHYKSADADQLPISVRDGFLPGVNRAVTEPCGGAQRWPSRSPTNAVTARRPKSTSAVPYFDRDQFGLPSLSDWRLEPLDICPLEV